MIFLSTDYVKHPLDKPYSHQHEQYKKPIGEIDTLTSYHRDYTGKIFSFLILYIRQKKNKKKTN